MYTRLVPQRNRCVIHGPGDWLVRTIRDQLHTSCRRRVPLYGTCPSLFRMGA